MYSTCDVYIGHPRGFIQEPLSLVAGVAYRIYKCDVWEERASVGDQGPTRLVIEQNGNHQKRKPTTRNSCAVDSALLRFATLVAARRVA